MSAPQRHFQFATTHTATQVTTEVLAKTAAVKAAGRAPVVLFDLDGTLFDNGPRTWQILYEFALGNGRHTLTQRLGALQKQELPYTLADILALTGETSADVLQEAAAFWKQRFFTDEYIRYDEPVRGAIQFAHACYQAGATLVYFSGRDSPGMLVGTAQSLRTHGFPVGVPRAVLTLKEAFEVEDLVFKRDAVAFLQTLGTVVASFDNEPANCNLFQQTWPDAVTVALATTHAPNPKPLHPSVKVIGDFVE